MYAVSYWREVNSDTWDQREPPDTTCDLFAKGLEANDVLVTISCSALNQIHLLLIQSQ